MIRNCPFCGKAFDVIRPQLWKFKENNVYFCTYTCKQAYDRKEENEMKAISKEQKQQAVRIALDGGDPKPFLAECGSKAPDKLWYYIKNQLKAKEPETYEKLAKAAGMKKQVETPEKIVPIEKIDEIVPKKPLVYDGYTVRCIEGNMGRFYYDKAYDRLDWTTPEGEEVSFSPSAWKVFATEELPKVMAILGVEL